MKQDMKSITKISIQEFLLLCITFVFMGSSLPLQWGNECPVGCQCQIMPSTQTFLARRQHKTEQVKAAMCVFHKHRINTIAQVPYDTEVFTFLQAPDSSEIMISNQMMTSFQHVKGIDMQGSVNRGAKLRLASDIFHSLQEIEFLSLQRIDLTDAEKAFAKISSLEILQVVYCVLSYIKWEMLDGLTSLKELYIVKSGIKELNDFAFYGAPELRRLYLSHNDLFDLEADAFIGLLKLEHLDLSSNKIGHISGLTFPPMPNLQWLELKHNPIKVIFPHCFQYLNSTQHLTLGHKHQAIHIMKFSFRGLYSLMFLHIPNIDNDVLVEHMFYDLRALLHLNLQGRIRMLSDRAFNGANRILQKLILHDCKLLKISEDAFHGLTHLMTLDLSTNALEYLPVDVFEPLETIQELILSHNKFKTLHEGVLQPLSNLKALRLDSNPWNCTCDMMAWKEEMVIRMPQIISNPCTNNENSLCSEFQVTFTEDRNLLPRCEYPIKYQGLIVFEVIEKYFQCEEIF